MVAHNEPAVSPTPEPGSERAIDRAAMELATAIRDYAEANPEYGIPAGQRLLVAQTIAFEALIPMISSMHDRLDDVFPAQKMLLERKRDVLMSMLTTILLPELLDTVADNAAICGADRNGVHEAVYGDVDLLNRFAIQRAERVIRDVTRGV